MLDNAKSCDCSVKRPAVLLSIDPYYALYGAPETPLWSLLGTFSCLGSPTDPYSLQLQTLYKYPDRTFCMLRYLFPNCTVHIFETPPVSKDTIEATCPTFPY